MTLTARVIVKMPRVIRKNAARDPATAAMLQGRSRKVAGVDHN